MPRKNMPRKPIIAKLDTRPYRMEARVVFDDDYERSKRYVERFFGAEYPNWTGGYAGRLCWNEDYIGKGFVILLRSKVSGYTIAHECFHAVRFILEKFAGLRLTDESEEAYSYLIGELYGQVERAWKKRA